MVTTEEAGSRQTSVQAVLAVEEVENGEETTVRHDGAVENKLLRLDAPKRSNVNKENNRNR